MNRIRAPSLLAIVPLLSACALLGTADAYVQVEGNLVARSTDCSIRFHSVRTNSARGERSLAPGPFEIGFMFHGGEKLSDFRAELSCGNEEWRQVGPSDAFQVGTPVLLGAIGA